MIAPELWLIIGVILLMALAGGWWWFAHDQKRIRQQRRQALAEDEAPSIGTSIRWSEDSRSNVATPPSDERIHWGEPEVWFEMPEHDPLETDDERVKCPVCHQKLSGQQADAYICSQPDCQTVYHQHCWREYGEICLICRKPQL